MWHRRRPTHASCQTQLACAFMHLCLATFPLPPVALCKQLAHLLVFPLWQGLFGKSLDSPAAADADASDTQSVDSGLSRPDSGTSKRDTVCHVSPLVFSLSSRMTAIRCCAETVLSRQPPFPHVCLCVLHRSARSMERAWWCAKATAIGSSTWSVSAWRPYPKAGSPVWNVKMVSGSGGLAVSMANHLLVVWGSWTTSLSALPPTSASQAIMLVSAVKRPAGRWRDAPCPAAAVTTTRTASWNSPAPPAVQEEDFAALSTPAPPAVWRETCNEPAKVRQCCFFHNL